MHVSYQEMNCNKVNLKRSKSTGNLCETHDNAKNITFNKHSPSEVSEETESNASSDDFYDSGHEKSEEPFYVLEKKLDIIIHVLRVQQKILNTISDDISKYEYNNSNRMMESQYSYSKDNQDSTFSTSKDCNDRSKSLLDAIEMKRAQYLDQEIKDAILKFLQSDDLKDRVAATTAECVKSVISNSFTKSFPSTYMPILDNFHMRLLKYVTRILNNAFRELEGNSAYFYKSVNKTSQSLLMALEKHENLLESTDISNASDVAKTLHETLEDVLKTELADWRQKLLNVLTSQALPGPEFPEREESPPPLAAPPSPAQPADPDKSIIEQLLRTAEINKFIKDGDINKAFEEALLSSDLSLVMAACRAADPASVFTPCCLQQSTLLSLVQQLATDMVHETQLKCRYLEEAIINLDSADPHTRSHLPLVVGEVRKHISKFLQAYPSHFANRRLSLIILAAENLLK